MNEKAIKLIRKIQNLIDRGDDGERENAERMLVSFLRRHDMTLEDLEGVEIQERIFEVPVRFRQLFVQVMASIIGRDREVYGVKGKRNVMLLKCTAVEYTEITMAFAFYKGALIEQLSFYEETFYQKNALYDRDYIPDREPPTQEELMKYRRMERLMGAMSRVNHSKLIT